MLGSWGLARDLKTIRTALFKTVQNADVECDVSSMAMSRRLLNCDYILGKMLRADVQNAIRLERVLQWAGMCA